VGGGRHTRNKRDFRGESRVEGREGRFDPIRSAEEECWMRGGVARGETDAGFRS
jgi:hypothetical protein